MTIDATVMILTRNSAETLPDALRSVVDFAEIIVCDGESTDDTREIAERHGAIVLTQDRAFVDDTGRLVDYAGARHQVVRRASKPWVFHLDADEIASAELAAEIAQVTSSEPLPQIAGFRCHARHVVDGTTIQSAANYPMSFLRLFRRDAVVGYHGPINEHPEFPADATVAALDGEFLIPMPPLTAVLRKWARYLRIIGADALADDDLTAGHARERFRNDMRVSKWLAWRTWKTRRSEPAPHMPLRYDLSRVAFHVLGALTGYGARTIARVTNPRRPS